MQEQELFQNYELKNWNFSPRLYKILGASALLNIFVFILLAQANFLTAKSCDTPFVSGVCTVLDTLYVGAMLADTDVGYVSEDYQKTELEDADIIFIQMDGQTPPLEYPTGYFALANPEQAEVMNVNNFPTGTTTTPGTFIPGITTTNPTINNGTTDLTTKAQVTPTPNKNVIDGILPNGITTNDSTITQSRRNNRSQTNNRTQNQNQTTTQNNTTDTNNQTQQNQVQSETVTEANINKQVLKDYAKFVKEEVDNKKVDLNEPFKVVVEGVLTKDGKFDISKDSKTLKAKTQFTYWEGNEQVVNVAKKALEAIGDSGWLIYLRNLGAENFKITLIQDGEKIFARVETDMKDANKAKSVASGLNTLLTLTKNNAKLGDDERILLSGAQTPTSNGNICIIDFAIPKADAQAMIERNLKKVESTSPQTENQNKTTTQSVNSQTTGK